MRGGPARLSIVAWLVACAVAAWLAARAHYVADLSAFLPSAPTPEQAVLLDQLKNGAASRLVLAGIEGGDAATRDEASMRLAAALRSSDRFTSVDNGDRGPWQDAGRFVFAHRYALSPAVDAARFSTEGLRAAIDDSLALLGTPAGLLIKPVLFSDPTGETMRIAETLLPARAPKVENGVWVSRVAPRAVLVMSTRADGADLDAQKQALATIREAFAKIAVGSTPTLRLELSGAGSFGVAARDHIKAEVLRLAVLGGVVMFALLWLAFASLRSLAIAALPVATGALAGIAAVSLGFGQVHGMTLGFGTTLIGEGVDYAIYYLVQARGAQDAMGGADPAVHWLRQSWPTVRIGLFTSLVGFAALVFAGFPGLAQLGAFSIAGLAAAAATTRFVFPVIAPRGAPGEGVRQRLGRFMTRAARALPQARWAFVAIAVLAAGSLLVLPSPWRGALTDLSPLASCRPPARCRLAQRRRRRRLTPARWSRSRRPTRRARSPAPRSGSARASTHSFEPVRARRLRLAGALPAEPGETTGAPCGTARRHDARVAPGGRHRRRRVAGDPPAALRRRGAGGATGVAVRSRGARGHATGSGGRRTARSRRCDPTVARPRQSSGGGRPADRCGTHSRRDRGRCGRAARQHQGRARRDLRAATCARRSGRPPSAPSPSSPCSPSTCAARGAWWP